MKIIDRQSRTFRSPDLFLNDLAIIHRLAVGAAHHRFEAHGDARLAIKSIELAKSDGAHRQSHDVKLNLHTIAKRKGVTTCFSAEAISSHGHDVVQVNMIFDVIPAVLVSFLRQSPAAAIMKDVRGTQEKGDGKNCLIYQPDDLDSILDGERGDHIPALRLIDLGLGIARKEGLPTAFSTIEANFRSFIDPKQPVYITWTTDDAHLHFIQNHKNAASVSF
ncbi:hypothetical protein [Agrobacterium tumefaciens]|uniref:hypothetical protein n=1 Tax=Agrobacterium tumefaciens TaxID=358 RepID=UPI002244198B|nr:hypothetical protein [Agrobacterium tumefaciens]MCW8060102.1 hypothetical protein [Agrobacterium tumefaciens]